MRVVSSAHLRLLIFLPAVLIPACESSSLAFHLMYSAYKLNKVTIYSLDVQSSPVQSLSHVQLFAAPWITVCQASLSITNSWSLPRLIFIESVMPSNHLTLCCHLLLLPSIFPNSFPNSEPVHSKWASDITASFWAHGFPLPFKVEMILFFKQLKVMCPFWQY